MRKVLIVVLLLLVLGGSGVWWESTRNEAPAEGAPVLSLTGLLAGEDEGFARVTEPRKFRFPRDHAAHPEYRHEWWYFTGNLQTPSGRAFGYQFTLFRFALLPESPPRGSAWAPQSVYMGHLAVSDIEGGRFLARQKVSRGAVGLAGAASDPFAVWIEGWRLQGDPETGAPAHLSARSDDVAIDLQLTVEKPLVFQGERGLSQKGAETGNASYYYSYPRLATRGKVTVGSETLSVEGQSWMDHEWGSSALGPGVVGWDWFALQLQDGRDLMFYHLRRDDGTTDTHSAGTLIAADGSVRKLTVQDINLTVLSRWQSPQTGIHYPAHWQLRIPSADLTLEVQPRLSNQEWTEPVRYWEGAVAVNGSRTGSGYVELTGYGEISRE